MTELTLMRTARCLPARHVRAVVAAATLVMTDFHFAPIRPGEQMWKVANEGR